ncbi:hypothetical protein GCM10011289_12650 [Paludibacterium paludis]|uniref:Uncharacterized protein n=1 Tax=Paludibacterium paludis TaxID=1225769 RepID=A0A918P0W4_9NEIS|nr:hypothetical protein GCM10011289_12650 [Paludibacterium paludis]
MERTEYVNPDGLKKKSTEGERGADMSGFRKRRGNRLEIAAICPAYRFRPGQGPGTVRARVRTK